MPELFERPNKKTDREKESEEKYDDALKTLGMMKIENEFLKKVQATIRERSRMIERIHAKLCIDRQCKVLGISRSSAYYSPVNSFADRDLSVLKVIREVLDELPFYGYRKVAREIQVKDIPVTEKQVRRIMTKAGLSAIFPGWTTYILSASGDLLNMKTSI